jgi:hypothetical protein
VLDKIFNLILNSQSIDFTSCKANNPVLGPKIDEVTGEWRKLHNEELHNLYSSPDEVGGACGTHGRGEKSV